MSKKKEPNVFKPVWPEGLVAGEIYSVLCDDKGREGHCYLRVAVSPADFDVHVGMQDWERFPEGKPSPFPSIRVRTLGGGGKNIRTRQALLWLADAMRRDAEDGET